VAGLQRRDLQLPRTAQRTAGRGYRFKTGSDSEVLLHLYDAEGDDFVHRLNGMFDFALWDARRRRLLIGRDRLGVKPLYVLQDGSGWPLPPKPRRCWRCPACARTRPSGRLADYLHLGYVAGARLHLQGHPQAAAGHPAGGRGRSGARVALLAPAAANRSRASPRASGSSACARLDESVRMQMVSDVPIGAFLSGGVDSSAVVGLMARTARSSRYAPMPSASRAAKPKQLYNELPYARRVAELFSAPSIARSRQARRRRPAAEAAVAHGRADCRHGLHHHLPGFEFARQDVKVILSGVGGDELFGGYRRYLGGHYAQRYRAAGMAARRAGAAARLPADRHSGLLNTLAAGQGLPGVAEMTADERYRSYLQVLDRAGRCALLLGREGGRRPSARRLRGRRQPTTN
jgi:asparagine synthase (glutamine-hydrolysing)